MVLFCFLIPITVIPLIASDNCDLWVWLWSVQLNFQTVLRCFLPVGSLLGKAVSTGWFTVWWPLQLLLQAITVIYEVSSGWFTVWCPLYCHVSFLLVPFSTKMPVLDGLQSGLCFAKTITYIFPWLLIDVGPNFGLPLSHTYYAICLVYFAFTW